MTASAVNVLCTRRPRGGGGRRTESTVQSIQEPGGSGSGSGGGVSGSVVVGYQEGAARRLGLCVPQEGLLGSSEENTPVDIDGDTWNLIDIALDTHGNYDDWKTILVTEKTN